MTERGKCKILHFPGENALEDACAINRWAKRTELQGLDDENTEIAIPIAQLTNRNRLLHVLVFDHRMLFSTKREFGPVWGINFCVTFHPSSCVLNTKETETIQTAGY